MSGTVTSREVVYHLPVHLGYPKTLLEKPETTNNRFRLKHYLDLTVFSDEINILRIAPQSF